MLQRWLETALDSLLRLRDEEKANRSAYLWLAPLEMEYVGFDD